MEEATAALSKFGEIEPLKAFRIRELTHPHSRIYYNRGRQS